MELVKDNIYRERKDNGKYKYYVRLMCDCGQYYFTDKYKPSAICLECYNKISRAGRPIGYKLSIKSKDRIRKSRLGQVQDESTRDKISASVKKAFDTGLFDIAQIKGKDHSWYACGKDHCFYKHGHNYVNSPLYRKFRSIYSRCYNENNPSYKYYGAKGIEICKEWLDDFLKFKEFLERNGFRKGKHLHRIDNKGLYSPDNVIVLDPSTHSKLHALIRKYKKNN